MMFPCSQKYSAHNPGFRASIRYCTTALRDALNGCFQNGTYIFFDTLIQKIGLQVTKLNSFRCDLTDVYIGTNKTLLASDFVLKIKIFSGS